MVPGSLLHEERELGDTFRKTTMRNLKRVLSLALSAVMAMSLMALPVAAAGGNYWVSATLDGNEVYRESYPSGAVVNEAKLVADLGVGVDVKVSVANGSSTMSRPINMSGTLPNGTVYRLFENSDRSLSLTTTNRQIKDDISVDVVRTAKTYNAYANSGPKGFKNDLGSDSAPTCDVEVSSATVDGNTSWDARFIPEDGLVIKSLNIRTTAGGRNIVDVDAGSVTVGDTRLTITRTGDVVRVHVDQMANNLYVTALTAQRAAQYELSVVTIGDVTSNVVSTMMEAGSTKSVVLTPGSTCVVDTIEVNDGGKTGRLTTDNTAITVNGHTYRVTRDLNGKATVEVPAIAANVKLTATATSNKAGLTLVLPSDVRSNQPVQSFPEKGANVEVRLTPDDDSEITAIKIESATDSVILTGNEYRFILDGRMYRVDTRYDSSRTLFFDSFPGNVKITVESREFRHTIKLSTDKGCDYEGSTDRFVVDDGGSKTFSFVSLKDYAIERIVFTYNGRTVEANRDDSYITINGSRCPITWEKGRVTVIVYDVTCDMTVKARTDSYDEDYVIRVDCDGGVTTPSSRVYANYGNSRSITFTNRSGYRAQRIDVIVNGRTYSAYRNDTSITIDGRRCTLTWTSTKATINLNSIRNDMDVFCDSDYEGTDSSRPVDGDYVVTLVADNGCSYTGSGRFGVSSGSNKTVTFNAEDNWRLQRLVITYRNETYRVSRGTSEVYINGYRCAVDWSGSTKVSLTLRNIRGDVTVSCESDYDGPTGTYYVERRAGTGSQIYMDPDVRFVKPNQKVNITVTPEANYEIDTVEFKLGSAKAVSVSNGGKTLRLNGKSYTVNWTGNGSMVVEFDRLTNDLTVTSTAKQSAYIPPVTPEVPQGSIFHTAYVAGVGGGKFQPDRAITRAEAVTMLVRAYLNGAQIDLTGATPVSFLDVAQGAWYYNYISYAYNQGRLVGLHNVSPVAFRPNDPITRAEFVELAERFMGVGYLGFANTKYPDVLPGHWASGAIDYATNQGWITGFPDGSFGPEYTLTRAQLVTIVNKLLNREPNKSAINSGIASLRTFSDVGPAHWAYYQILEAANAHYVDNYGAVTSWVR